MRTRDLKNIFSGDRRTVRVKQNVVASILLKGVDVVIYLLLVPLTLGYLNSYEYGIWLTLNSVLLWINTFDIGLGNGLRNKLAIAMARGNKALGRAYVSTTFYALIIIVSLLLSVFYIFNSFIDWYSLLNVDRQLVTHLSDIVLVSFVCFCLNFVFKFVGNIYLALQLPAVTNLLNLLGHGLALIIIIILTHLMEGNLFYVAIAYSISPVIVYVLAYPITFVFFYRYLSPSIKNVRLTYLKEVMGIGIQFFFLQIAGIILFASSNIIISNILGPEEVTPYNIAYRYFSVVPLGFNVLITPMWSAVTEAYTKGDMEWIRKSMLRIRKMLFYTAILILIMILCSHFVYNIWIGNEVLIPWGMTIIMGVYSYIIVWSLSYSSFLNGIGILRMQIINIVIVAVAFFPMALFLIDLFGVLGIALTMCLTNISGAILNTIQIRKILSLNVRGIWCK